MHRDWDDLQKFVELFIANNLFSGVHDRLSNITSGLAVSNMGGVNCDEAVDVGARIMKSIENLAFSSVTMKKSAQAKDCLSDWLSWSSRWPLRRMCAHVCMCAGGPGSIPGADNLYSGFHPSGVGKMRTFYKPVCRWVTATEGCEVEARGR
jgi:hypothetical protein